MAHTGSVSATKQSLGMHLTLCCDIVNCQGLPLVISQLSSQDRCHPWACAHLVDSQKSTGDGKNMPMLRIPLTAQRPLQVDGVRNEKVQSVYLEDLPVHQAAFAHDGQKVGAHSCQANESCHKVAVRVGHRMQIAA